MSEEKVQKPRRSREVMVCEDLKKVQRNLKRLWLDTDSTQQADVMQLVQAAEGLENAVKGFFSKV